MPAATLARSVLLEARRGGLPWLAAQRPILGSSDTGLAPREMGIDGGMMRDAGVTPSTVSVTDWAIFVPLLTSTGKGRRSGVL